MCNVNYLRYNYTIYATALIIYTFPKLVCQSKSQLLHNWSERVATPTKPLRHLSLEKIKPCRPPNWRFFAISSALRRFRVRSREYIGSRSRLNFFLSLSLSRSVRTKNAGNRCRKYGLVIIAVPLDCWATKGKSEVCCEDRDCSDKVDPFLSRFIFFFILDEYVASVVYKI